MEIHTAPGCSIPSPDQLVLRYKDILDNISEISTLNFFEETAGCITPFYKKIYSQSDRSFSLNTGAVTICQTGLKPLNLPSVKFCSYKILQTPAEITYAKTSKPSR